jgi:hypothetical protein
VEIVRRVYEAVARRDTTTVLEGGKIIRVVWFKSREDALEAVGLSE